MMKQGFIMYNMTDLDNGVLTKSEFAVKILVNINAGDGVLTCVRLPHESGKVPVKLLFNNAMELSCSTHRSMS